MVKVNIISPSEPFIPAVRVHFSLHYRDDLARLVQIFCQAQRRVAMVVANRRVCSCFHKKFNNFNFDLT